jgi:hypothetical protein
LFLAKDEAVHSINNWIECNAWKEITRFTTDYPELSTLLFKDESNQIKSKLLTKNMHKTLPTEILEFMHKCFPSHNLIETLCQQCIKEIL